MNLQRAFRHRCFQGTPRFAPNGRFAANAAGAGLAPPRTINEKQFPPPYNVKVTGAQDQVRPKGADAFVRPC
jgi:hypothetical protein